MFFLFSPIFVMILGLCSGIIGVVALVKPSAVKFKRIRTIRWVRLMGSGLVTVGIFLSCVGAELSYHFYVERDAHHQFAGPNLNFATVGGDVPLPTPSPATPTPPTSVTSSTTTSKTSKTITASSTSITPPTTTPPTTTTTHPTQSHKYDHPTGKGKTTH